MQCHVFTNPQQGASYDDVAATAKAVEDLGLDGFFRSDHFLAMAGAEGLPGPTDTWVTLGALARETRRIRLGSLMTSATFRHPGLLVVTVAQVDQMSNGRVDFGFGTGWHEPEHRAYGVPYPAIGERFDRFEEQLAIITGLWNTGQGEVFTHHGRHYQLTDAPGLPKPVQRRSPVIIGGAWQAATPTSSTTPSRRWRRSRRRAHGWTRPARRSAAHPRPFGAPPSSCWSAAVTGPRWPSVPEPSVDFSHPR